MTSHVAQAPFSAGFRLEQRVKTLTFFGESEIDLVEVPQLSLGQIAFQRFLAIRGNEFSGLPQYKAVIGADLLKRLRFLFHLGLAPKDPSAFILSPSAASTSEFTEFGKMINDENFIAIEVEIAGKKVKAMWDTHVGWSTFSRRFLEENAALFEFRRTVSIRDAGGHSGSIETYKMKSQVCILSKTCVTPLTDVMALEDLGMPVIDGRKFDLILGNNVIWQLKWFFDPENSQYSVLKTDTYKDFVRPD